MHRVSHTRPAPSEFPQDRKVARVGGCSGAMYSAYPFFVQKLLNRRFLRYPPLSHPHYRKVTAVFESSSALKSSGLKFSAMYSIRYMHAAFSIPSLSSQPPRLLREVCHVGPCICPFSEISHGVCQTFPVHYRKVTAVFESSSALKSSGLKFSAMYLSGTCMLRSPFHPCPHNPQGCCGKSVMSGLASAPFLKFRMVQLQSASIISGNRI